MVLDSNELFDQLVKAKLEVVPDLPRQLKVRKTEEKIAMIIRENGKDGINHSRLADLAGIDRKNLRPYARRLIAKGIIKREQGKQGKYYPTDKDTGTTLWMQIS